MLQRFFNGSRVALVVERNCMLSSLNANVWSRVHFGECTGNVFGFREVRGNSEGIWVIGFLDIFCLLIEDCW